MESRQSPQSVSPSAPLPTRILLVEDTRALASSLARGFREQGLEVAVAATARAALRELGTSPADVMILDLGLPDLDGVEVLRAVRERGQSLPILVLTARDAVSARVEALNAGADDYVTKPFAFEELSARVAALLRRAAAPRWAPMTLGLLQLQEHEPLVSVAGQKVRLSPRERALLEFLLRRRGEVVARSELLSAVFGYDFDPKTNLLDVHMTHLRRKIAGSELTIETVRGFGYRLQTPP